MKESYCYLQMWEESCKSWQFYHIFFCFNLLITDKCQVEIWMTFWMSFLQIGLEFWSVRVSWQIVCGMRINDANNPLTDDVLKSDQGVVRKLPTMLLAWTTSNKFNFWHVVVAFGTPKSVWVWLVEPNTPGSYWTKWGWMIEPLEQSGMFRQITSLYCTDITHAVS